MKFAAWLTRQIDRLYIAPARALMPLQTFRYGVCGSITTGLDLFYYWAVYHFLIAERDVDLGLAVVSPHIFAFLIVFPVTYFNSFWLNRHIAFPGSPLPRGTQALRLLLSALGAIALNYLLLKFFVEACHIWATPSKIITTAITIVYSYLVQKYFTFRGSREA